MYARRLPGQHSAIFSVECGSRVDGNDGNGSTGSWETAYSADDVALIGLQDYTGKGVGNETGSPMSQLHAFDRTTSASLPQTALCGMASLSLEDSQTIIQAAIAEQQGLGWGGRPLHPAGYVDQQQHMRVAMPEFSPNRVPSPVAGAGFRQQQQQQQPHPQQQHHGNAHRNNHRNGHQQGNHNGYNRNNHGHNQGGNCHGPRGGNGRGPARANSGNGGGSGDPRGHKGQSYRRLWQQVTCVNRGGHLGGGDATFRETTVEDLLEVVRHLPPEASAVKAVAQGLYFLDSGALAALLKELNKAGHSRRAQEIFDWLRALEPTHDLYGLCNTMTYTTMISQCGTQQALRRALELVAEMRGRGVQCNVHTYSALMNVCIKANELDLALDVYRQMLAEGCTPNLVTFNTLIDVYGKTGAWEEAVAVLDALEAQGIEPEVRTYNTVIIACNQSSRASEALRVYERMLAAGAQPTATTYTALISAYGKAGQLDAALQIFQDMVSRGCERNVITYSSLISACEKVGRWELALQLFQEMHLEGCRPNVVTYNSLIAACAQGAQWEKAQELFEAMQAKGCRPDSVTFGGLIAAYDRAGHWRRGLAAFEQMRSMNCRPDTVVYNTVIGALWKTGLVWAHARATQIFHTACRQGHFRMTVHTSGPGDAASASTGSTLGTPTASGSLDAALLHRMGSGLTDELFGEYPGSQSDAASSLSLGCRSPSPATGHGSTPQSPLPPGMGSSSGVASIEFGMHAFTVGSASLSLLRWVTELRDRLPRDASRIDPSQTVSLVLNKGKPSREHTYPAIRAALCAMLTAWSAPLELVDIAQGCRIEGAAAEVAEWVRTPPVERAASGFAMREESPRNLHRDAYFHEDSLVEARCAEAFAAVRRFESVYAATAAAVAEEGGSTEQRKEQFRAAAMLAARMGLSDEVLYDGFLLIEKALAAAKDTAQELSQVAVVAACLDIAAKQAGERSASRESMDTVAGLQQGEVASTAATVRTLLQGDTSSISALRVLKLFMERLGADFAGPEGLWPAAGSAFELLPGAVCEASLRKEQPSLVAAAVLLAGRRAAGLSPFWPTALAALTGHSDGEGSVLSQAALWVPVPV